MADTHTIGKPVLRLEDEPLVRGRGRFVDDLKFAGMLEAAFVRSPHAHAVLRHVDADAARRLPGVHAVFALADLAPMLTSERLPLQFRTDQLPSDVAPLVLAKDEVAYVGEAVAVVIAQTRAIAEDAAASVAVDYEPLPAVSDCRDALRPGAPLAHRRKASNLLIEFHQSYGDIAGAFARAPHRARVSLKQHRGGAHSIEGRGAVAVYDVNEDRLTLWSSTQLAHEVRAFLMRLLQRDENQIRVVAPDVGGGFGAKFVMYPEEVVLSAASLRLRRPIKWVEDRREHFLAAVQEREQYWDLEAACDGEGRVLGLRGELIHDQGAYTPQGAQPALQRFDRCAGPLHRAGLRSTRARGRDQQGRHHAGAGRRLSGSRVRHGARARSDCTCARARSYRGAAAQSRAGGENALCVAAENPLRFAGGARQRRFSALPAIWRSRPSTTLDFAERQGRAREHNRHLGIGVGNGVKGTGRGPFESGIVRIGRSGRISVYTGAMPMGQGIKTALAQICAEQFVVPADTVTVMAGDTAIIPYGQGGFASRQTVTAGSAVHMAAVAVREKVLSVAAHLLETGVEDLELRDGRVEVVGAPGSGMTLREVAEAVSGVPGYAMPGHFEPGLESLQSFLPNALTYGMGCHAVEVEVDAETGSVRILRYVVVNDSGRLINPMIVEGQLVGGTVHGIGNTLYEWMGYDAGAQPLTTTFADYLLASATEVPKIEVHFLECPSPLNPLGVKGVGESGCVPAAGAIVAAVENALSPFGVTIGEYPVTPARLFALIAAARS